MYSPTRCVHCQLNTTSLQIKCLVVQAIIMMHYMYCKFIHRPLQQNVVVHTVLYKKLVSDHLLYVFII